MFEQNVKASPRPIFDLHQFENCKIVTVDSGEVFTMLPYSTIDYAAYQSRPMSDAVVAAAFTHSWLVVETLI
jgi:hypothetical protein